MTTSLDPSSKSSSFSKRRRSSFFQRLGQSFKRSGGARGADVHTLRGTNGADFEGTGRISPGGGVAFGCCFSFGADESQKDRLILIKGPFCFVYSEENAQAPKYAIGLQCMRAEAKGSLVLVKTNLGDVQYEVQLENKKDADIFATALRKQASSAEAEEVRMRLGHGGLLNKRASVRYAEKVAIEKVKDQPDKPISTIEVLENMPQNPPF